MTTASSKNHFKGDRRMRAVGLRRRRLTVLLQWFLIACAAFAGLGLFVLALRSLEPSADIFPNLDIEQQQRKHILVQDNDEARSLDAVLLQGEAESKVKGCATVEEMGQIFSRGFREESLRARKIIHDHFVLNGTLS